MHGSPLSKFDNKELWEKYDYRTLGIIGEPYFDIDFNEVFYLTDTGRRWDGDKVSIPDKVLVQEEEKVKVKRGRLPFRGPDGYRERGECGQFSYKQSQTPWPSYHSTHQIIEAIENGTFPQKAMLIFHPQRWTNKPFLWTKEIILQNAKNIVKLFNVPKNKFKCYTRIPLKHQHWS